MTEKSHNYSADYIVIGLYSQICYVDKPFDYAHARLAYEALLRQLRLQRGQILTPTTLTFTPKFSSGNKQGQLPLNGFLATTPNYSHQITNISSPSLSYKIYYNLLAFILLTTCLNLCCGGG